MDTRPEHDLTLLLDWIDVRGHPKGRALATIKESAFDTLVTPVLGKGRGKKKPVLNAGVLLLGLRAFAYHAHGLPLKGTVAEAMAAAKPPKPVKAKRGR
jgi:hypothetical protein